LARQKKGYIGKPEVKGETTFKLLGIMYNIDLNKVIELNY
jgi:hypothetical protein